MQLALPYFTLLPLAAFLASLFLPRKKERPIVFLALGSVGLHLAGLAVFITIWLKNGLESLEIKQYTFFKSADFEFSTVFFFDETTAVFAIVGTILTALVAQFSRFYMHREAGFKRFFSTLLLFFAGYQFVVFSGNFETFFIGWEILGITSFLLISFFRDRYLPVKNGFKVLSFYRLGDLALVLAMWMSHHLFHKNIRFSELSGEAAAAFSEHSAAAIFIGAMLLLAAAIKSAQLPFSTWLPRAMEGPTTSSAIFYGSLSVHIGAFLLLRTSEFWQESTALTTAIIVIGATTALVSTFIARVQPTVKTQIAYASIAQIGLIFIEIALGWHLLALVHFAGNAFLRTYQLLVSPSVLSYLIHDMFFNFEKRVAKSGSLFFEKIRQAVFVLSIREWNFDDFLRRVFWQPFKLAGEKLDFSRSRTGVFPIAILFTALICEAFLIEKPETAHTFESMPTAFAGIGLLLILKAFAGRGEAQKAWIFAVSSQFFMLFSMLPNPANWPGELMYYVGGWMVAAATGFFVLKKMYRLEGSLALADYQGHSFEHGGLATIFLLSCLAFAGFPITPTFIGIDLMFARIGTDDPFLLAFWGLHFLFLELTLIRIYCRVFLGQHRKMYHPVAFKSS